MRLSGQLGARRAAPGGGGKLARECSSGGTRAQLLARRFTGPRAGINVANDVEPLFRFGERREVAHVQTEALAIVFAAAADEKAEALQLW